MDEGENTLTNLILNRILYRMKVTALIPDSIVEDVKTYSGGKNITESLMIALTDWLKTQKLKALNTTLKERPLEFIRDYSAENIRNTNRKMD